DFRAEQLKDQERAGKPNARLNSGEARKRADEMQARLQKRMEEIKQERQLSPLPPVVLGGVLVVPVGLLATMIGQPLAEIRAAIDTQASASRARAVIMEVERGLGYVPVDGELEKLGYDIESAIPGTGRLRFIEVKGRVESADTITVTKNEILYSLNKPDDFILAMVAFAADGSHQVRYLRQPFHKKGVTTDFAGATVNFPFAQLLEEATEPS
ncbi:MAG: RNA helicase, partial [Proteobacteria bacterium]